MLVLHRAPEPFDEDVVHPSTLAVHADCNVVRLQDASELLAGELSALVGVKNLRPAVVCNGLFERLSTKVCGHGVRQPPRQNFARGPVENRSVNQSDGSTANETQDKPGFFDMKKGTTTQITGSASEQGGANNESAKLQKCTKSLGTIAVVQPQDFTIQAEESSLNTTGHDPSIIFPMNLSHKIGPPQSFNTTFRGVSFLRAAQDQEGEKSFSLLH